LPKQSKDVPLTQVGAPSTQQSEPVHRIARPKQLEPLPGRHVAAPSTQHRLPVQVRPLPSQLDEVPSTHCLVEPLEPLELVEPPELLVLEVLELLELLELVELPLAPLDAVVPLAPLDDPGEVPVVGSVPLVVLVPPSRESPICASLPLHAATSAPPRIHARMEGKDCMMGSWIGAPDASCVPRGAALFIWGGGVRWRKRGGAARRVERHAGASGVASRARPRALRNRRSAATRGVASRAPPWRRCATTRGVGPRRGKTRPRCRSSGTPGT
jgi:hypothetical protein